MIRMDFKDCILQVSDRITKQKDLVKTEEATKMAFIAPMISALGYDIFDPSEVIPEMDCDLAKKGDKIDYAIQRDGEAVILIECKSCSSSLDVHSTQLSKYFAASNARFGVLTNGIEYRFFTDIDKKNIMDEKPFLVIDVTSLSDYEIDQLKKFHKSYYNETDILSNAQEQKYTHAIKAAIMQEFQSPSSGLVSYFARVAYEGRMTQGMIDTFTPIVAKALNCVVNDIISDRLSSAMNIQPQQDETLSIDTESGIITTEEEIEAFNIVRSILREHVDVSRIQYKDCKSYFVVNLDGSWKWICRLFLGARKKSIGFPLNDYGKNEWIEIESIDSIFSLKERLYSSLQLALKY